MSIIGIDIGTSGCKVCSFNSKGKLLSSSSRKYPEKQINGTREIKPDQVRDNVLDAFEETILKCPEPVQAIAVTCLGESLVCLDSDDHVLYPSMVTGDNRGQEGVDRLCESLGADYIFSITGLMPSQLYSLPKMIWMKDHTTVFQNTHKIFFYEDYIGYLLTGERKISYSSAARSMALDIHNLKWNEQLLSFANLTPKHFSEPVPSGTIIGYVKKELASRFHLTENVPVVAGGHDQACAAIGSGFINASIGEDCIGTCECLALMLPSEYDANTLKMLDMPCMIYPVGNAFFTTLEITTCGVLMNWARDNLFKGSRQICEAQKKDFFQYMDERIAGRKTEVLILPQFGSSGHPDLNYHMSACISGLTLETKEEDLYLALKESMIYQIKLASEYASPLNLTFDKLVMTGGAANSLVSAHLRADIYQKPVYILENNEAGTLGCMILAAVAIGEYPDIFSCIRDVVKYSKVILPNSDNFAYYEDQYKKFKDLYNKMHLFPSNPPQYMQQN